MTANMNWIQVLEHHLWKRNLHFLGATLIDAVTYMKNYRYNWCDLL
jgi:hypothetical protein